MSKRNLLMISFISSPYIWLAIVTIASLALAPLLGCTEKVDNGDITNFYTAFIALCTTFVVGFQIYNSIELNRRIEDMNSRQDKLEKTWSDKYKQLEEEGKKQRENLERELKSFKETALENNYYNAYNNGTTRYTLAFCDKYINDKRLCWNAIRSYFMALRYAAQGGHDFRETIDAVGPKIIKCIGELKDANKLNKEQRRIIYANKTKYIDDTNKVISNTDTESEELNRFYGTSLADYKRLVKHWNDFTATFEL
ncbi:MAG: hypothetical protein LUD00_03445 [Prevotellaceae bacterium]|nr:hypothetical protein [Prevotellaceae bacterium]